MTLRTAISRAIKASSTHLRLDMSYIVRGSFWLNARTVLMLGLTFGLSIAFANLLTPDDYGRYRFIISGVTFWGALLLTGANIAVTRGVARGAERTFLASIPAQLTWNSVATLCIAGTGVFYLVQGDRGLGVAFLAAALVYPLTALLNTYSAYFSGKRDFRSQAFYETLATIIYVGILSTALFLGASAGVLAILFFASYAIGHGIGFIRAYRAANRSSPVDTDAMRYARNLTLVSIPATFMLQLDNILVFHYLGSADLAMYTYAMLGPDKIAGLLRYIPTMAIPKYANRASESLRTSIPLRALQMSIFGAGIALLYFFIAPFVFRFFLPQYISAIPYSRLYALSLVAVGSLLPLSSLLAQARVRRIAVFQFGLPFIQLLATYIGVRFYGLRGAIIAKLIGDFANFALISGLHQYRRNASPEAAGAGGIPAQAQ
ncbi:MAG: oligosaccharide flippase family protein [Candidatus Yanofskybacteria bacterium]|nr:oligosaccharide flippase family protein [Candidatus Yanofskybacteria bacterium]